MEQVLIATDLYVHNQTKHIVLLISFGWLSAAEPNLGIPAEPDLLDTFLSTGAISQAQHDKSLSCLIEKMGINPESGNLK